MSETVDSKGQPRVSPETNPDEEQARILAKTLLTPSSEPLNLFRVLVRYPELMKRVNGLGGLFMAHGSLDTREREMVILRVARRTSCDYEFAQHSPIGIRVGLTEEEIRQLGMPIEDGSWAEDEAKLLEFADQIVADLDVSDQLWDSVASRHEPGQMMELALLVGYYRMLAGFIRTLRIPLEEGAVGLPADRDE
ncbi:MAG: carboxymuconolactone decarboxylase family protein [Acidimicrobiia bacterium]|nr:carboxymuconolactone decarboxylase family protein [Acidimicrobiia bacterium]